jgi:RND family efflux transporter MFP subunit
VLGSTSDGWVVRVALADRDLVRIERESPVDVSFDAFPGRAFAGRVSRIASAADPATGTFEVEVEVQPQGARFVRGLVAKVELDVADSGDADARALVPVTALVEANGHDATVYVLDSEAAVARRKKIAVGPIVGDRVVVRDGLDTGERVITDGAAWLRDGQPVAVIGERG